MTAYLGEPAAGTVQLSAGAVQPASIADLVTAPLPTLPRAAARWSARSVLTADLCGRRQAYSWEPGARPELRRVTNHPTPVLAAQPDACGSWIWWFASPDGGEPGRWRRQPFAGGPDEDPAAELPGGWPAGLALPSCRTAFAGFVLPAGGSAVHRWDAGRGSTCIYTSGEPASVLGASADGRFVALEHSEGGSLRESGLKVVTATGEPVLTAPAEAAEMRFGGFSPVPGDGRLLLGTVVAGRWRVAIRDLAGGVEVPDIPLAGDLVASWFPTGRALLVLHSLGGTRTLHRCCLDTGACERLGPRSGTVADAEVRADGTVVSLWSSSQEPWQIRVIEPGRPGPPAPPRPAVPATTREVEVPGPAGPIHTLVTTPTGGGSADGDSGGGPAGRRPCLVMLHGGPHIQDYDAYSPRLAGWARLGVTVVRVNFRGSSGFGMSWRDAIIGRVGLTELEDVAAVRHWLVAAGVADPARLVLSGASWGGYLTLLALGRYPRAWCAGVAHQPVADLVACYERSMDDVKSYERGLHGGSPAEVPERYRRSSPITYVARVRRPLLITAARDDAVCPPDQIAGYVSALRSRHAAVDYVVHAGGHGDPEPRLRAELMAREIDFVRRCLPGR